MKQKLGDIILLEGTNELNVQLVPIAVVGWVSPTGHIDPEDKWANPERAYDDITDTFASTWGYHYYGEPLELTLDSPIYCDKVRIYAASFRTHAYRNPDLSIDLHYDGAWHNIFSGVIAKQAWVEIPIPAGTKMVDSARIKWNEDTSIYLYELSFWSEG